MPDVCHGPPAPGRLPANPFATRHTRPGRLPALDGQGVAIDMDALANSCLAVPAASLEGPHGHGKTTIMTGLIEHLAARGITVILVRMVTAADGRRALAAVLRAVPGTLVCIDGWERVGRLLAAAVLVVARCRRVRVLVTAHRSAGVPVAMRCGTSARLLEALVDRLPDHGGRIVAADVADAFARHGGNLRESLYDLYDRFERRIR